MRIAPKENATPACSRSGVSDALHPSPTGSSKTDGPVSEYLKGAALARPLSMTVFSNTTGSTQRTMRKSLSDVATAIPRRTATRKDGLPLIKLARFGTAKSRNGSLRHNANVLAIEGVEGDHDTGAMSVEQARECLEVAGLAGLIYTTPSHSQDKPRWRVLCPLSRSHAPDERESLCARLNGALGGALQGESFTLSQTYFYGSVAGQSAPMVVLVDGRELDLADELDTGAVGKDGKPYSPSTVQPDYEPIEDDEDMPHVPDWERIGMALDAIPVGERDNREECWRPIGMALHNESRASERGFDVWDEWSQAGARYDARDQRRVWNSFGSRGGKPLGIGTLYKMAKEHGWEESYPDPDIARLNERHALVMVQGRALIATEEDDGGVAFGTDRDLNLRYANERVAVNEKRDEAVSARWLRHPLRRTYTNGVEFAPGGAREGSLNLWRGWAVQPDATASCRLILRHIANVICKGDPDHTLYVIGWLAHMVQLPQEKPGVALVLRGAKGTGKDTFADYIVKMIGERHAPTVANSEHIVGRFNRRLENALLLHVQEGSWAGDKKAEELLKYLVTSDRVEIERKGIDSINLRSVLRLIISANADWVVPASHDERRWAVFEVSDARKGDEAYFRALRAEMNGQGPAALLHFLQTYDLSGFNVRAAPETEGLRNQKLATLSGIYRWWFDTLNKAEIGNDFADWESEPIAIAIDHLHNAYVQHVRSRRYDGDALDSATFGKQLRTMLPEMERKRHGGRRDRSWVYVLPSLPTAREGFAAWLGAPVEWEAEQ
jgi:hypothetical protein